MIHKELQEHQNKVIFDITKSFRSTNSVCVVRALTISYISSALKYDLKHDKIKKQNCHNHYRKYLENINQLIFCVLNAMLYNFKKRFTYNDVIIILLMVRQNESLQSLCYRYLMPFYLQSTFYIET